MRSPLGAGQLSQPYGLAIDGGGNVYVTSQALLVIQTPSDRVTTSMMLSLYPLIQGSEVWFLRVPILIVQGGEVRKPPFLQRYRVAIGPLPVNLASTLERAEQFGAEMTEAGLELYTECVPKLTDGKPLAHPDSWG